MYTPGKPQTPQPTTIVFYNSSKEEPLLRDNMIVTDGGGGGGVGDEPTIHNSPTPLSSGVPKKRAEIWVQEETRALISLRKELDLMFNTSKSNKHLWESISSKMRERGFDRSPTMCTDKWRNLLKEYKKAKQNILDGSCSVKMSFYKEIDGILKERTKNEQDTSTAAASKVEPFMPFADKGIDDASLTFGPVEGDTCPDLFYWRGGIGVSKPSTTLFSICTCITHDSNARSTLNLERSLDEDHHHHPLAITAGGASPWNWRETPPEGENSDACDGRVITVKYGDYTKRIGIDGTANAIKEAVKSAFRLRTKRAFWLEDEDSVVRSLDRDMPIGNYTLHVDEGLTIKVCCYEDTEHLPVHTEDKTFYTEEDFRDFLSRRCWTYLREYNGFRHVDSMDELCPGAVYRGVN